MRVLKNLIRITKDEYLVKKKKNSFFPDTMFEKLYPQIIYTYNFVYFARIEQ